MVISKDWKPLTYEFEIHANQNVELICESRGQGSGAFDLATLRLNLKGP
jgi:hypothetical protein